MAAPETIIIGNSRHRRIYRTFFSDTNIFTTVTSTHSIITRWIHSTRTSIRRGFYSKIIGLGVQWETCRGSDPAATLQICVRDKCLIVQLSRAPSVPRVLRRFLDDQTYTFVGFWNHFDAPRLANCRFSFRMRSLPVDMRHYASTQQGESLAQSNVHTIVRECFGYQGAALHRAILWSQWETRVLTTHQVEHATIDAYAAYLLGNRELNSP